MAEIPAQGGGSSVTAQGTQPFAHFANKLIMPPRDYWEKRRQRGKQSLSQRLAGKIEPAWGGIYPKGDPRWDPDYTNKRIKSTIKLVGPGGINPALKQTLIAPPNADLPDPGPKVGNVANADVTQTMPPIVSVVPKPVLLTGQAKLY